MHRILITVKSRRLIGSVLAAAFLLAPAFTAGNAHADSGGFLSRFLGRMQRTTIDIGTPTGHLKARIEGNIAFNDAEDDVTSVNGKATLIENRHGKVFRMVFEADSGGGVKRTYSVDGRAQALDADGRKWLASAVPTLLRETARDSGKRIKRLFAKGGADAVLNEIDLIQSDFARRAYIQGFMPLVALDEKRLHRLLDASKMMESDFERRSAMLAVIASQTLNPAHQVNLLNGVEKMDSAFEQRSVLVALGPKLAGDDGVAQAWHAALKGMDSDFELRSVIEALARRDNLTPAQIDAALRASLLLDSDFEHRSALVAVVRHLDRATPAQVNAFLASAQEIDSDFERRSALMALVKGSRLDKDGYAGVIDATRGMDSDFEIGAVLVAIAKQMPADRDLVARYRKAARALSDFERGQAEKALDHLNL